MLPLLCEKNSVYLVSGTIAAHSLRFELWDNQQTSGLSTEVWSRIYIVFLALSSARSVPQIQALGFSLLAFPDVKEEGGGTPTSAKHFGACGCIADVSEEPVTVISNYCERSTGRLPIRI